MIETILSSDGQELILKLKDRFDIGLYHEFSKSYKDKIGQVSKCCVDLTEVEYIDSSALGMLLMLRERAGGDEAAVSLENCSEGVKKILDTAHFDRLFKIN